MLSPYLRWGCLSARECEERARRAAAAARGVVRQLRWRDFYAHVLLTIPGNVREEFQERYRGALEWADDDERLAAWQEGRTGFPLVDAGMRQLAQTGWMHNRVRLVVGSFLTKDLHLDWRAGEAWFARLLLDGEPAQNNGNWQWIASVGADPAPGVPADATTPRASSERFDPDGAYVRRWVPELRDVPPERLPEPWTMSAEEQAAAGCVIGRDYPEPIVDHARRAAARARALPGGGERRRGPSRPDDPDRGRRCARGRQSGSPRPRRRGAGVPHACPTATPTAATTMPASVTWTSELASETLRKRLRTIAISSELARHDDVGDLECAPDIGDEERQRVQRAADERRAAGDDPALQRAAPTGQRPVVGQRLGHAHADRRAERRGEPDQQRGARAGHVGRREDRRERRDRPVDEPDQAGLDDLQEPVAVGGLAPSGEGGLDV